MLIREYTSPPAWTIGKDSRDFICRKDRDMRNVSPLSYNSTFADRKKEPAYSLIRRPNSIFGGKSSVPEPAQYDPIVTLTKM